MFKMRLFDGKGWPFAAEVTPDQELSVISAPYPTLGEQKARPFRQYLTDDGTASGSNDMGVDGSSTNVDFFVQGDNDDDRYITALNFIVAYGSTGQPNEWADGTALTNGSRLFYSSLSGEIDIHDAIKNNQDLFRLQLTNMSIPGGAIAGSQPWEVRHINAANDFGYFINFDLTRLGLPYGIKLDRKTDHRLTFRVRDNAGTDADTFNCIAYGFDRFK